MTLFVCTVCCEEEYQEAHGCSIDKPETRNALPIFCTPDEQGNFRQPKWEEEPKKKQTRIS